MKLHKLKFVLPNLFTITSIFCGFYALTLCAGEASPSQLYQAALAIFFAMFFDGFDGRVARLTRTQSQFGVSWTVWQMSSPSVSPQRCWSTSGRWRRSASSGC